MEGALLCSWRLLKNLNPRVAFHPGVVQLAAGAGDWLGGNPLFVTKFQLEISCLEAAARTGT